MEESLGTRQSRRFTKPSALGYPDMVPEGVRDGKFIVRIYSNDHPPPHVHVSFDNAVVRVLITESAVTLDTTDGKPKKTDIAKALRVVAANLNASLAKWKDVHG